MKQLLSIDTANEYLSLALSLTDGEIATFQSKVGNKQSQYILPTIQNLLTQQNINLSAIDGIAYNQGPGSFTGLRIGLSVAIALAYSLQIPLYPVDMFQCYARIITTELPILVILDARLGQIYAAVIEPHTLNYLIKPSLLNPEQLETWITTHNLAPNNFIVVGTGYEVYQEQIQQQLSNLEIVEHLYPEASMLLKIALQPNAPTCTPQHAELLYLRDKVALNLEEQRQGKKS